MTHQMKRKYTYDKNGEPIYIIDEYGAAYFIAPDGSWTRDYDGDSHNLIRRSNVRRDRRHDD